MKKEEHERRQRENRGARHKRRRDVLWPR